MENCTDPLGLFSISSFDKMKRYGNLLISYETLVSHIKKVYKSQTNKRLPNIDENYLETKLKCVVEARKMYIEYIKNFANVVVTEFCWSADNRYYCDETTVNFNPNCVIIQGRVICGN